MRLTMYGRLHTIRDMADSNMRTLTVRFTPTEHRVLRDLAAASGLEVEALIREALMLPPLEDQVAEAHLHLVRGAGGTAAEAAPPGPALP